MDAPRRLPSPSPVSKLAKPLEALEYVRRSNTTASVAMAVQRHEGNEHLVRTLQTLENESSMRYRHYETKPWLDEDGHVIWPWLRVCTAKVVMNQAFETFMGLIIFANVLLIVFETNQDARCYPDYSNNMLQCPHASSHIVWAWGCNVALQVAYSLECVARLYVERSLFLQNRWNLIDLFIVLIGWAGMALTEMVNLNVLRIFRVIRLLRAGRLLISVPELYILLSGLTTSFKAIFFGSILLISVVFVWAIVTVEIIHPVNVEIPYMDSNYTSPCPQCASGFATVYRASLTLFSQIVAGDAWGQISPPLAHAAPWTAPILFGIMMTISLGVMNLILAVIVEKAAEARQTDLDKKLMQKDQVRERNMVELALMCDRMDKDGSGALSLEEMMDGYANDKKFYSVMQGAGVEKDDLQTMFNVLDTNDSGEVDYVEFCNQLGKCQKTDPLMVASMTRYSVMELKKIIRSEVIEALKEQKQMMQDQLELFRQIPSCQEATEQLHHKWSRRKPLKRQNHEGELTALGEYDRKIQAELEQLLVWARQLRLEAPSNLSLVSPSNVSLSPSISQVSASAASGSGGLRMDPKQQWFEIGRRFKELSDHFEEHLEREKAMHQQCHDILSTLSSILQEHRVLVSEEM
ncbi:Voltage-dependent calcium channel type D subunit alpha-1 (DmCa1D) [Durusdinium trenchii]|uniref:Voltage-dependent calcium channel type D subunit alpha-1 (DmCa1D) n=1 Tax=Durusdinium trenchii TaxID=1381693 RepID=A0ABP0KAU6_9DINO